MKLPLPPLQTVRVCWATNTALIINNRKVGGRTWMAAKFGLDLDWGRSERAAADVRPPRCRAGERRRRRRVLDGVEPAERFQTAAADSTKLRRSARSSVGAA